ncbi:MAG: class II aldolase/adducin family protein [Pseudomonadota bacterium]
MSSRYLPNQVKPEKRLVLPCGDEPQRARKTMTDEERQRRIELAAAYRLAARFGFSDIVWNHITAKIPGGHGFLINRFGLRFDEVTASNLVTIDLDGHVLNPGTADSTDAINTTGFVIHRGIHAAHADVACVMHSHTPAGMAVSTLKDGLTTLVLDAMVFHNRVAYHPFEGASVDRAESERLVASLGSHRAMILKHHGLLTCGATVGEAFIKMFYLDRACAVQIAAMSTGQTLAVPPASLREKTAQDYAHFPHGKYEWPALLRLLDEQEPDYKS